MQISTLAFTSDEAFMGLMIPIIAVSGSLVIALVAIVSKNIRKTAEAKAHEESRREIAAYVAEGSMSPDDAFKLLTADPKTKSC